MSRAKAVFPFFLFCIVLMGSPPILNSQPLQLKIAGDSISGFHVDILSGDQMLVTNTEEFSIDLFNTDYSTTAHLDWKGETWSGNEQRMVLQKDSYIKTFDANLSVTVTYEVINENLIRKTVRLFQPSMPDLLYTLQETSRPATIPERYVTFEYDSFPGGMVHEMYPAAGFITPDNKVVGFLTDAGYKNQYTRNTRRRFSGEGGGFVGMRKLPDANLLYVASQTDRAVKDDFIRYTFGEMYDLDAGTETVLKLPDIYQKEGHAEINNLNENFLLTAESTQRAGVDFMAPFEDQQVYTISFLCKGDVNVALKLFRIKNGQKTIELEDGVKYIDHFPTSTAEWKLFKGSILVPYIEHDSVSMFIGTETGKAGQLQIKDLQITEHHPRREAYNILPIGETARKDDLHFC